MAKKKECTMDEIKQKVRDYLVENFLFGDTEATLEDDQSLIDSGVIDSTGVLELITFLETEFGIAVEDDEVLPENLDSINNIAAYIERKKKE
jgi:acyl carrier protein